MIVLADQTHLNWAVETTWGQPATTGFTTLPISTENLTGIRRHIRPQVLGARPILPLEENANGEIDTLVTPSLLVQLLQLILMSSFASQNASISVQSGQANNITLPSHLADVLSSDDYVWLDDDGADAINGWTRYHPASSRAKQTGVLKNSETPKLTPSGSGRLTLNRITTRAEAGAQRRMLPMTINKRYGEAGEWVQYTGMTMRRLDLATTADSFLSATASFIGKQASLQSTPFPTATAYNDTQPYSLAASDIQIRLIRGKETLDLNATDGMATTGFRLVMEYPTMQPRFGLGSLTPQAILVGDLRVHGTIEVMVTGLALSKWFGVREVAGMECSIQFNGQSSGQASGGGFAFRIPRLRIAETSNNILLAGEPVRQVLRFDADVDATSNNTTPLVACYYAPRKG